jgi:Ca2+-binding RTX toxin-like protein
MTQVSGRMKTALLVGAVAVSVLVSGAPVLAASIPCPVNSECVGTEKADTFQAEGQNTIDGKNGNDRITDGGGGSFIIAGGGNDRITSKGGASVLHGRSGNDCIVALKGLNTIFGGQGEDVIKAKNDEYDDIDCGPGKDTVIFDVGLDQVTGCESQSS